MQQFKPIRYTRAQVLDCMHNQAAGIGIQVSGDIKLESIPEKLRHPCTGAMKIVVLPRYYFNIPEMGTSIPYAICNCCGRLYIPDNMNEYLQTAYNGVVYNQWN